MRPPNLHRAIHLSPLRSGLAPNAQRTRTRGGGKAEGIHHQEAQLQVDAAPLFLKGAGFRVPLENPLAIVAANGFCCCLAVVF